MAELYNAADLYLTTSLGEGWGLGITEALGCGCPAAVPMHTSCAEIADTVDTLGMCKRVVRLPIEGHGLVQSFDNSRWRQRVRVDEAAERIQRFIKAGHHKVRPALNESVAQWLSWDRIAARFATLMLEAKPAGVEAGGEQPAANHPNTQIPNHPAVETSAP